MAGSLFCYCNRLWLLSQSETESEFDCIMVLVLWEAFFFFWMIHFNPLIFSRNQKLLLLLNIWFHFQTSDDNNGLVRCQLYSLASVESFICESWAIDIHTFHSFTISIPRNVNYFSKCNYYKFIDHVLYWAIENGRLRMGDWDGFRTGTRGYLCTCHNWWNSCR